MQVWFQGSIVGHTVRYHDVHLNAVLLQRRKYLALHSHINDISHKKYCVQKLVKPVSNKFNKCNCAITANAAKYKSRPIPSYLS
jgi:hypothetical protein